MDEDYAQFSRDALIRASKVSELAIFWSLVLTVILVVVAMIKGISA